MRGNCAASRCARRQYDRHGTKGDCILGAAPAKYISGHKPACPSFVTTTYDSFTPDPSRLELRPIFEGHADCFGVPPHVSRSISPELGPSACCRRADGRFSLGSARRVQSSEVRPKLTEMVFYGAFTVFGLLVVPNQEWFWPSKHWWADFTTGRPFHDRYLESILSSMLRDTVKVWFLSSSNTSVKIWEMLVHHFVTVLIGISYVHGWNRVGAVVMILLDPADVPLHIVKQLRGVGDAHGGKIQKFMQSGADLFFVIFMLLFAVMRLGLYPYVVWSTCGG